MDYLLRATDETGAVRALAAVTTNLVSEAARRHQTYPVATAALGRALTAVGFLGANLKGTGKVTLRIAGDGPLGGIVASGNGRGEVRGYVKDPTVSLPSIRPGKLDVGGAVGRHGFIHVVTDLGLKEPYTGGAPLISGEIAEDLANYFRVSEQTPSAVALGVLVGTAGDVLAAGGLMVQLMPGASEGIAPVLEGNLARLGQVSRMINEGGTAEDLLRVGLEGFPFRLLDRIELRFHCDCNRQRAAGLLAALGRDELSQLARNDEPTEMRCLFCGTVYRFSPDEVRRLLDEVTAAAGEVHRGEVDSAPPAGGGGPEG